MAKTRIEDMRNLALVGHGACGKTTLADLMLFKCGVGTRPGSVDEGTSLFDFDEEEKQHKYSISSSLGHFQHQGKAFTIIDTPGYPDFLGQAIGALRAVETAVIVVNAGAGIEVNTRKVFALSGDAELARAIVINKLDQENIRFAELVSAIQETFGNKCVLINVPNGLGGGFTGVLSTLRVTGAGSPGAPVDPAQVNQALMDAIVESDEQLMERYLEGGQLEEQEVDQAIRKAVKSGTLIPIFCISAKTGAGVAELLDGLAQICPAPCDFERRAAKQDQTVSVTATDDGPLVGQVFKTRIDPFVSRMSFVRIISGRIAKETSVQTARSGKPMKVANLFRVQGGQQEPIDSAGAGEIVALIKMEDLQVGDTVTDGKAGPIALPPLKFPTPMIGLAVEPKSRNDQQKISGALHRIEEEDQTFHVTREAQTHEMVMRGLSDLHLKIVEERLHRRDKVEVITRPPKIPYRETVIGTHEGFYRHKKQTGGAGQFGEVHMRISPMPQGQNIEEYATKERFEGMRSYHYNPELNYLFVDRISGGSIPNQFIPAVEKGISERMEKGVIAGYQVQDVCVELYFGKDHPVDSNENAFKTAGAMCFKQEFSLAKPVLLEPIVKMEITVPADKFGDITSDLNSRRGRVEGMDSAAGGFQTIIARAPLAEVTTYARSLSSMTGGRGSFTMEFSHYETVPGNEQAKIVAAAGKAKEEEE